MATETQAETRAGAGWDVVQARLDALEEKHARQMSELEQANAALRAEVAMLRDSQPKTTQAGRSARGMRARTSRRRLLQLGGAAVAAAGAAVMLNAQQQVAKAAPVAKSKSAMPLTETLPVYAHGSGNVAIAGYADNGAAGVWAFTDTGTALIAGVNGANPDSGSQAIYANVSNNAANATGTAVGAYVDHGIGVRGVAGYSGVGVQGNSHDSYWPGVLGENSGNGYGMQAVSWNGSVDLFVGANSKTGVIGQQLWTGSGVPLVSAGAQLRDGNADMWLGTFVGGLGVSRKVATLAPGATLGGSVNYLAAPVRLLDARSGARSGRVNRGALNVGEIYSLTVAGLGGSNIPAHALGLICNVTVLGPTGQGSLSLFPAGATPPTTSSVTFLAGSVVSNHVNSALGSSGGNAGKVSIQNRSGGVVPLVLDAVGFIM